MTDTYPAKVEGLDPSDLDLQAVPDPDPGQHIHGVDDQADNTLRAQFAALGLKAYAERTGTLHQEDAGTILKDFIGDIQHLCDVFELDFQDILDSGSMHYEAELRGVL